MARRVTHNILSESYHMRLRTGSATIIVHVLYPRVREVLKKNKLGLSSAQTVTETGVYFI